MNDDITFSCVASFPCTECDTVEKIGCTVERDTEREDAIIYKATCEFNSTVYTSEYDASTDQLYAHWAKLCGFYG